MTDEDIKCSIMTKDDKMNIMLKTLSEFGTFCVGLIRIYVEVGDKWFPVKLTLPPCPNEAHCVSNRMKSLLSLNQHDQLIWPTEYDKDTQHTATSYLTDEFENCAGQLSINSDHLNAIGIEKLNQALSNHLKEYIPRD